jgi:hypothetical protein
MHSRIPATEAEYEAMGNVLRRRDVGGQLLVGANDHDEAGIYSTFEKVFWNLSIRSALQAVSEGTSGRISFSLTRALASSSF